MTILIMMKLLLCQTARMLLLPFLSQRLVGLPIMRRPLPSLTILCRVNWKRFTKQTRREIKENWTCLRNQKCWSLLINNKIKELFPETCHACGGAISLKQTMSGAVLTLQWNCDSAHFGTWASSDVLTVRNNQKVYVNNFQMAAAITQWK